MIPGYVPEPCRVYFMPYNNMLFSAEQGLVIPVNCVGVMGAGLALKFKHLYPEAFLTYKAQCESGELALGRVTSTMLRLDGPRQSIAFFVPTKNHWSIPSSLDMIAISLEALRSLLIDRALVEGPLESIAIPKLGCGLGQLAWADVRQYLITFISRLDSSIVRNIVIYGHGQ